MTPSPATPATRLGRLALARGWLTAAQLDAALQAQCQESPAPPLEIVLVERGALTAAQMVVLLSEAEAGVGDDPGKARRAWRFGLLAERAGYASSTVVLHALRERARRRTENGAGLSLEEILVERRELTVEQVADLTVQMMQEGTEPEAATQVAAPCAAAYPGPATVASTGPAPLVPPAAPLGLESGILEEGGRRFGRYELLEELGRGGMGIVYRAYDRELRREVAVKTLRMDSSNDPEGVARFLREGRIAAALDHPAVVPIFDIGAVDGVPYYAMGYIRGRTLQDLLASGEKRPLRETIGLIHQAAIAVAHAHERQVVHRDLKPSNLMIDSAGRVHILDFGLARKLEEGTRLTGTGQMLGTLHYMPPEQIEGESDRIGAASDVYALGAILYEVLTGGPPFTGASCAELLGKVLRTDPEPPRRKDRRIPQDLETICLTSLRKEPGERYPGAHALAADLERYLAGEAILARPENGWERGWRWGRRRKGLVALAGAAVMAMALAVGAAWQAQEAERRREEADRERSRVEDERRRLAAEVLRGLRSMARVCVSETLAARRRGDLDVGRRLLPQLEDTYRTARERLTDTSPEPDFYLGRMLRAMLREDDAREFQDRALAIAPGHAPAWYERSVLAVRRYLRELPIALSRASAAAGARMAEAGELALGRGPAVTWQEAPVSALEAQDPDLVARKAEVLACLRRVEEALAADAAWATHGESLLRVGTAKVRCLTGIRAAYEHTSAAEAERELGLALGEDVQLEEAYEALWYAAVQRSSWERAVEACTRGIEADHGYVPHWRNRGTARRRWGRSEEEHGSDPGAWLTAAVEDFTEAIRLDPASAETWMERGEVYVDWGAYRQFRGEDPGELYARAIADYDRSLELDAANAVAWVDRAAARTNWSAFKMGRGEDPAQDFASAIADFDRALAIAPGFAEGWRLRGTARDNAGSFRVRRGQDPDADFAAGIADFAKSLELDPLDFQAWAGRGDLLFKWGIFQQERGRDPEDEFAAAIADYGEALELNPESADVYRRRGDAWIQWDILRKNRGLDPDEKQSRGMADYAKALELNPACVEAWAGRGEARATAGAYKKLRGQDPSPDFRAAIADYDRALELHPAHAESWTGRGEVRLRLGVFERGRGRDPAGEYAAAIADFDAALRHEPTRVGARRRRGDAWREWGALRRSRGQDPTADWATAIADYDEALRLGPGSVEAQRSRGNVRYGLAIWRQSRGEDADPEFAAAIADFDAVIEHNPTSAEAWRNRGDARASRGTYLGNRGGDPAVDWAAAIADYDEALRLGPASAMAWSSRGRLRTDQGVRRQGRGQDPGEDYAAAIADFTRALEIDPANVDALFHRGLARHNWGTHRGLAGSDPRAEYDQAIVDYGRALEVDPAFAPALHQRGRAHFEFRRWAQAIADFEASALIDPAGEPVFGESLAHARAQVESLDLHERAMEELSAGRYAAARILLEGALTKCEEIDRRKTSGLITADRTLRVSVHYNLACILSRQSAGREGPAAEAALLRDSAFAHLERALDLGWTRRAPLEQDGDFVPLQADPRWGELLSRLKD